MKRTEKNQGFSLPELMIAMLITLVSVGMLSSMLGNVMNIRARENVRSDAIADTRRALNMMTREISNSGFGLTNNGLIGGDSDSTSIRFRANLNAFEGAGNRSATTDEDEDIKYLMYEDEDNERYYIVRHDVNTSNTTVLANRIDNIKIRYYAEKIEYTSNDSDYEVCDIDTDATEVTDKADATYIVVAACVSTPAMGLPGTDTYQPPIRTQLVSDIMLRNSALSYY
jgi:prepilin-type N-terminal cleavage/methylation domain-containing protein